jgi:hypothetical protein
MLIRLTPKHTIGSGRIRMEVVPDRSARSLCGFVEAAVEPGAVVVTDAWGGYATLPDPRLSASAGRGAR